MKKGIALFLIVCVLLSGCSPLVKESPQSKIFAVESYHLQITADGSFSEKTGGSFDLQITNNKSYISIMAFQYIDLPQDSTPLDVYDAQNNDLFSKREKVTVVEKSKTQTITQGTATYGVYSAEKDGTKNYYATYLMDFPEKETFAWVLISATPSYYTNNTEYLHNIVCSLAPTV